MINYEVLINRLNGTPLSVYRTKNTLDRTKKTTAMAHLSMLQLKIFLKTLVGLSKTIKMGVASKISRALHS